MGLGPQTPVHPITNFHPEQEFVMTLGLGWHVLPSFFFLSFPPPFPSLLKFFLSKKVLCGDTF